MHDITYGYLIQKILQASMKYEFVKYNIKLAITFSHM